MQPLLKDTARIRNITCVSDDTDACHSLINSLYRNYRIGSSVIRDGAVTLQFNHKHMHPHLLHLLNASSSPLLHSDAISNIILCDGLIIIVDAMQNIGVYLERVLKYAFSYHIEPVLFINHMETLLLQSRDTSEMHAAFDGLQASVNHIYNTFRSDLERNPLQASVGNVVFGSTEFEWAFTLKTFASLYSSKYGISVRSLMKKLCGLHYFDVKLQKWMKSEEPSKRLNAFDQFILKPLKYLHDAIRNGETQPYMQIIQCLGIELSAEESQYLRNGDDKNYRGRLQLIMSKWLPLGATVCDTIVEHLPSPIDSSIQKYTKLHKGPLDEYVPVDWIKNEIRSVLQSYDDGKYLFCASLIFEFLFASYQAHWGGQMHARKIDASALMVFVTKMLPVAVAGDNTDKSFIAIGRVFSGVLRKGQQVRVMGKQTVTKVENVVLLTGAEMVSVDQCPSGNICGIVGVDAYINQSATLCDALSAMRPFQPLQFGTRTVKVDITVDNPSSLPSLLESLKRLQKYDSGVVCVVGQYNSETVLHVFGTHHFQQKCVPYLQRDGVDLKDVSISDPMSVYRETVTTGTGFAANFPSICVAKSPNKHCRIYCNAEPMQTEFVADIENQSIDVEWLQSSNFSAKKIMARSIAEEYNWDVSDVRKIWSFGVSSENMSNVLVDQTKGVQFLNEVKPDIIAGFHGCVSSGILCSEPMRGVRFNIADAIFRPDSTFRRRRNQIFVAAKHSMYAAQIASTPRVVEPVYLVDIVVPENARDDVLRALEQHNCRNIKQIQIRCTSNVHIQANVSVTDSFGLREALRQTFRIHLQFSHWNVVSSDPWQQDALAHKMVMEVRERKGMKLAMPEFTDYNSRI